MPRPTWSPNTVWHDLEVGTTNETAGVYNRLLAESPVAYIDPESVSDGGTVGYWGIFGYDELNAAIRDYKVFSNVTPTSGPRILPLQADPPEHSGYRRLLNPFFTKEAVAAFEPAIRAYGREMLTRLVERGEVDFAEEFAFPFPTRVLCTFLGVPEDDWQLHHDWVTDMERATGGGLVSPAEAVPPELAGRIVPYIMQLIQDRRAEPRDDLVTGIVQGEIDGHPVEPDTAVMLVMTIMMAGHITTTSALGNLVSRLARDSELQDFLRAHPDRIPDAVEESLRIDGPQQAMPRRCVQDTEVAGHRITEGEYVVLNFGSANIDPGHWENADAFDLDRSDKRHLTFGRGLHLCVGQQLARLELRLVVEELLALTHTFRPAGNARRVVWPLTTVEHLPLVLSGV